MRIKSKNLRELCDDVKKYNYFTYPNHFWAVNDHFSVNIPLWNLIFKKFELVNKENLNFLEIGTSHGRSAVWLLENVLTNTTSKLTCVDIMHEFYFENLKTKNDDVLDKVTTSCLDNLEPYIKSKKCNFFQSTSDDFFSALKENLKTEKETYDSIEYTKLSNVKVEEIYDFIYLDGSHDPDQVLRDAINSFNFLKKDGLILFDDYGWKNPRTNLVCGIGIDSFLNSYIDKIKILYKEYQVLIQKI